MPKIPTYTAAIDYKPPRGDLRTAAMPGQALARFGEAVGEFGGKLAEYQKAREKKSEAESKQAAYDARLADVEDYVKSARAESERANGTARMMDELHRDIADFDKVDSQAVMERDWTKAFRIRDDIVGAIGDPDARAAFESDTAGIAGLHVALMRGGEVRRLSRDGRQDLDRNLALYGEIADNARHPLEFDEAMDLAVGEIRRKAAAGFLTAEDAANIEQTFYADVAERQVRRAIAADPQGTLASLEGGEDFATLPAARRARLIDEAARAVQDQAVARTTAAAADRRALEIRLPGFVTALRDGQLPDDGDEVSRDSLIAAFGDHDGDRRWSELEDARAFGQETVRIKWAPPDEIARLLDDEPDADAPDGAAESAPSLLRQAVDRRNQQLWAQPADYALANPRIAELHEALHRTTMQPKIPAALTAAMQTGGMPTPDAGPSDEDRRAATEAYANAALAEQTRLGLPEDRRQVLPKAMAQDLVARILEGDTKAAADTLSDLIATWGEAAPTALADLSRHGLPGEYRLLASLADPAGRQTFAKVLTAQAEEPGVLRTKVGDDADTVDGLLSDALAPVNQGADQGAGDTGFRRPGTIRRALDELGDLRRGSDLEEVSAPFLDQDEIGRETARIAGVWQDKSDRMHHRRSSDVSGPIFEADTPSHTVGHRRITRLVPPRKPISPDELKQIKSTIPNAPPGVDIDMNIAEALRHKGNDLWFYRQVDNGGPWDYKQRSRVPREFEDFGNFHYGATGAAAGYTEAVLLRMAGWNQAKNKRSDPAWGVAPSLLEAAMGVGGTPPFGDDPNDQFQISQGFKYFHASSK